MLPDQEPYLTHQQRILLYLPPLFLARQQQRRLVLTAVLHLPRQHFPATSGLGEQTRSVHWMLEGTQFYPKEANLFLEVRQAHLRLSPVFLVTQPKTTLQSVPIETFYFKPI